MTTELYLDGAWVDVTGPSDTVGRVVGSAVTLDRGVRDEMASVAPGRMRLALDNQDGRWSPDNPASPYYGQLRRNIPVRHGYGVCPAAATGSATSTTSHVAPSVTAAEAGLLVCGWQAVAAGAFNYTVPGSMTSLGETGNGVMAYESVSAGATGTRTATFGTANGYMSASLVLHGTSLVVEDFQAASSDNSSAATAELELADLQAGWWLVAFATAVNNTGNAGNVPLRDAPHASEGGWILLADSGEAHVSIAAIESRAQVWVKRVNRAGTLQIWHDWSNLAGYIGVVAVSGDVTDFDIRLSGEASSITPQVVAGRPQTSEVIVQGILRRLQQGARPLESAMRRAILNGDLADRLIAYWPCEDEAGSFSSALPGGTPMLVTGDPSYAQDATSYPGSAPLPLVSGSTWRGQPLPTSGVLLGRIEARFVATIVSGEIADGAVLLRLLLASAAMDQVDLIYNTASSGSLTLKGYLAGAEVLATTASTGWDGKRAKPYISLTEPSGTITATLTLTCMEGDLSDSQSDTVAGTLAGGAEVVVNPNGDVGEATIGQIFIWASTNAADSADLLVDDRMYAGYDGETAARRIERLSLEEGITCHIIGDPDQSEAMGPQGIDTLLGHYRAAEITDGGLLHELRQTVGIGYRTRMSLYNQPAVLSVAYTSLTPLAFDLTHDDRYTRNRVIVARDGGGEAVAEDLDGPLGVNEVGLYETKYQTVAQTDARLPALASWLLHIGTVDEPRARVIRTDLHTNDVNRRQLLALDVGDRLVVTNVPTTITSRDVDVLYLGASEVHRPGGALVELGLTARPFAPYNVGSYQSSSAGASDRPTRYDAADSAIASGLILPGTSGAIARTPNDATVQVTGDITLAIDARFPAWPPASSVTLVSRAAAGNYSYNLGIDTVGRITLTWSADGTATTMATSTAAVPVSANDRVILVAHLDVNNGAGGYTVTFKYSTDSATQEASATTSAITTASLTTLGSDVVGGATTSIFAGTTNLAVGGLPSGTTDDAMIVYSAIVAGSLSVSGSVRANPVFTGRSAGETSFTDDAGRTWSILGTAYIAGRFETGSDTTLLVHTPSAPYWTTSGPFPLYVRLNGCLLTVSAISGTGQDQQFTISNAEPAGVTIGYGHPVSLVDYGTYAL